MKTVFERDRILFIEHVTSTHYFNLKLFLQRVQQMVNYGGGM